MHLLKIHYKLIIFYHNMLKIILLSILLNLGYAAICPKGQLKNSEGICAYDLNQVVCDYASLGCDNLQQCGYGDCWNLQIYWIEHVETCPIFEDYTCPIPCPDCPNGGTNVNANAEDGCICGGYIEILGDNPTGLIQNGDWYTDLGAKCYDVGGTEINHSVHVSGGVPNPHHACGTEYTISYTCPKWPADTPGNFQQVHRTVYIECP